MPQPGARPAGHDGIRAGNLRVDVSSVRAGHAVYCAACDMCRYDTASTHTVQHSEQVVMITRRVTEFEERILAKVREWAEK